MAGVKDEIGWQRVLIGVVVYLRQHTECLSWQTVEYRSLILKCFFNSQLILIPPLLSVCAAMFGDKTAVATTRTKEGRWGCTASYKVLAGEHINKTRA